MERETGAKSMMNDRSKTSRNLYAAIPPFVDFIFCETMNHMINAEISQVIDHQLSKKINFSYFAAMAFHGMINPDLEQIFWP